MCSIMGMEGYGVPAEIFEEGFMKTVSRGPDMSRIIDVGEGILAFHRLSIMGLDEKGMQPFRRGKNYIVCNGEVYGFRKIKQGLEDEGVVFESESDSEILLPMYEKYGTEMFGMLDAEYALIIYDGEKSSLHRTYRRRKNICLRR